MTQHIFYHLSLARKNDHIGCLALQAQSTAGADGTVICFGRGDKTRDKLKYWLVDGAKKGKKITKSNLDLFAGGVIVLSLKAVHSIADEKFH